VEMMSLFEDDDQYNEHQIAWLGKDWAKVQELSDSYKEKAENQFFTIIGSINEKQEHLNISTMDYSKFMVENALSQHADCMPAVYVMNLVGQGLSDQAHYNYMMASVPRGRRYGKWAKLTENIQDALILQVIMTYYKVNAIDARMYRETLEAKNKLKPALKKMKGLVTDELVKTITKNVKEQKNLKKTALEW
jgi:hypothetical protein